MSGSDLLSRGAMNAVETCMGLKQGDKVLIVTDNAQLVVGNALKAAAEKITGASNVKFYILEAYTQRPAQYLPKEIEEAIPKVDVTFWAATSLPGELPMRHRFIDAAKKYARHGHMPNITKRLMEEGMLSDYDEVYALTHKVYDIVKHAKKISVSNKPGTRLEVEFDSSWRWIPCDGRYHTKGKWGNLPEGETFTAPKRVNGRLVTNLLGDWFSEKYGNFRDPLSLEISNSKIDLSSIKCENTALKGEVQKYLSTDQYSATASEFALPTNPLLIASPTIGNLLQDEKARVHIAFGDPYPEETGAYWTSNTHVDMLLEECDVTVDGRQIMRAGAYII